MLDTADTHSLAMLFHLNSEPWLDADGEEQAFEFHFKEMHGLGPSVALPAADERSAVLRVIGERGSCRAYAATPLAPEDIATLLAGAYGLTRTLPFPEGLSMRTRAVPSAGGLSPLELYVLVQQVDTLDDGLYHYNVVDHSLESLRLGNEEATLTQFLLAAPLLENANAIVFITAVFDRTLHKYGARGYRYILIEAGHAAQNLCLLATERGLGSLCVGGFVDSGLNRFLGLDPRTEAAVYCVGVGHPA